MLYVHGVSLPFPQELFLRPCNLRPFLETAVDLRLDK